MGATREPTDDCSNTSASGTLDPQPCDDERRGTLSHRLPLEEPQHSFHGLLDMLAPQHFWLPQHQLPDWSWLPIGW